METPEARAAYRLRKQLVEPVFGIVKEQQGARRFLVRGVEAVRSEWSLLAVAFNLRTLQKAWRRSFFGLTPWGRASQAWPSPSDRELYTILANSFDSTYAVAASWQLSQRPSRYSVSG